MADFVFIRIRKSDGSVRITDENDQDLPGDTSKPVQISGSQVNYAFWWPSNPICVCHGGRIVCG
jgi:hypothetical protein